jgi:hypothetical protein
MSSDRISTVQEKEGKMRVQERSCESCQRKEDPKEILIVNPLHLSEQPKRQLIGSLESCDAGRTSSFSGLS